MPKEHLDINFWKWFFCGQNSAPGHLRLFKGWIFIHALIGILLSFLTPNDLQSLSNAVMMPMFGILIGLGLAWAGNAMALLQTEEIEQLSEHVPGGLAQYVFLYQLSILVILITLVLWSVAAFGIIDSQYEFETHKRTYYLIKAILFCFFSLSIREVWQLVLGTQVLMLVRSKIPKDKTIVNLLTMIERNTGK